MNRFAASLRTIGSILAFAALVTSCASTPDPRQLSTVEARIVLDKLLPAAKAGDGMRILPFYVSKIERSSLTPISICKNRRYGTDMEVLTIKPAASGAPGEFTGTFDTEGDCTAKISRPIAGRYDRQFFYLYFDDGLSTYIWQYSYRKGDKGYMLAPHKLWSLIEDVGYTSDKWEPSYSNPTSSRTAHFYVPETTDPRPSIARRIALNNQFLAKDNREWLDSKAEFDAAEDRIRASDREADAAATAQALANLATTITPPARTPSKGLPLANLQPFSSGAQPSAQRSTSTATTSNVPATRLPAQPTLSRPTSAAAVASQASSGTGSNSSIAATTPSHARPLSRYTRDWWVKADGSTSDLACRATQKLVSDKGAMPYGFVRVLSTGSCECKNNNVIGINGAKLWPSCSIKLAVEVEQASDPNARSVANPTPNSNTSR